MLQHHKFSSIIKMTISSMILLSLTACSLSIGTGGKKRGRNGDDGDNIVVTTGGSSAPPIIFNTTTLPQTQYAPQPQYVQPAPANNGERPLQPSNR